MTVARLNFSHGDADEHRRRAAALREAARTLGRDVGLLGDLQGPKIRVRRFADHSVDSRTATRFSSTARSGMMDGNQDGVGVALDTLHEDLEADDILLLNDGMITLKVDTHRGNADSYDGRQRRHPVGSQRHQSQRWWFVRTALTDIDKENIKLAAELEADFLAVSFVRSADDVRKRAACSKQAGGTGLIVAKIERTEAVRDIDSIIDASDVIMVARGDLGVEMGYAELTGIQKKLIRKTRKAHKIVITATQMMESMIQNPIPTRAEVSDVANAVIDGTDAVMLSGETAVGKYPVEAISAMAEVCVGAEKFPLVAGTTTHRMNDRFELVDEAIAMATMYTANHMSVKAIIALTESGSTTRWMSRIRSDIPIYAFTPHEATSRRVALYRGVYPVSFAINVENPRRLYQDIFNTLLYYKLVEVDDLVIFTKGDLDNVAGSTNAMKVLKVKKEE